MAPCDDLWPHVANAVNALPADQDAGNFIETVTQQSPTGGLLALAMHQCFGTPIAYVAKRGATAGPRTAMIATLLRKAGRNELAFDSAGLKANAARSIGRYLDFSKWLKRPDDQEFVTTPARGMLSFAAVIDTVTDDGATVKVTFSAEKVAYRKCAAEAPTGEKRWDINGNWVNVTRCTKWENVTDNHTPKPVVVAKRFAAGLEKGRYVRFHFQLGPIPMQVHAGKNEASPIVARLGVTL